MKRVIFLQVLAVVHYLRADPGALDASFDPGTTLGIACCIAPYGVESIALQPDGMILVGGEFRGSSGDNAMRDYLARLDSSGVLDSTFNVPWGTNSGGPVHAVVLQPDGRILIGGRFTSVGGVTRSRIARLNADSTLDDSFDPGTGADADVNVICLQRDGKLLIGGWFANVNGTPRGGLARLNADGSLDSDFDPGAGANNAVNALALQGDGKVLVGGTFTSIDGTNQNRIARLNLNGSLDATFVPPSGIDGSGGPTRRVLSIVVQPDGRVLIGGWFSSANGQPCTGLVRLAPDGTTDTNFNVTCLRQTGLGGDLGYVNALALQPDGKINVVGNFMARTGAANTGIVRLYGDGSLDAAFVPAASYGGIESVAIQPDGKVLVGGEINAFAGVAGYKLARLDGDPMLQSAVSGNQIVLSWPASYTNFNLHHAPFLSPAPLWTTTTNTIALSEGRYVLTNLLDGERVFFRLIR